MVGAGVAPIAEEIYFRGLVYGYLRRWGSVAAILGSTLLFVAVHPDLQNIPFPQIIGGLLFAISYEVEKNLTRMLRAVGAEGEKPSATRLCVFGSDSVTSRL
ncbi:MAG: CPBP family intramembrane metalloprotease [Methanosarcinaceae archaeon]|nr:CPBP family intramembrane metalloprotease [Methanosarcinaceae archaeon]